MKISNSNNFEEFEILNDEDDGLELINQKFRNNNSNMNYNKIKQIDKITEEDHDEIKLNENLIINNELSEEKSGEENTSNTSGTFNGTTDNKEKNEILDFEKIELKEEMKGDFTEISISSLTSKKSKTKEEQIEDQNKLLLSIYQELNLFNINENPNFLFSNNNFSKTCINLGRNNHKYNIVKIMSVLKSTKINSWKDNFKSLMSTIYYNGYALAKKFDKKNPDIPLYIFDTKIEKVVKTELNFLFKTFLYMSYRSGLVNLKCIGGGDFTSDCGWGCMLRCSQMMLSKGLIQKKINDYFKNKNSYINFKTLEKIRKETLFLFSDHYLQIKEIKTHPDFKHYWELYKKLIKTNSEYKLISEVIPPYSIHILCLLGQMSGEYTSDLKMVKLFTKINSQLFPNFNILHFQSGFISFKKLISSFCEENKSNKLNNIDNITYNGINYSFKKEGIVFITFRFGLTELDPNYYDIIPLFFEKFRNNIGFVSGKKNKAYYFVGIDSNKRLIFFDPHYNQQISGNIEKDYESYFTENVYLLDINNLSSELTLGIGIYNSVQLKQFLEDIEWFANNYKEKYVVYLTQD